MIGEINLKVCRINKEDGFIMNGRRSPGQHFRKFIQRTESLAIRPLHHNAHSVFFPGMYGINNHQLGNFFMLVFPFNQYVGYYTRYTTLVFHHRTGDSTQDPGAGTDVVQLNTLLRN
jgi:hypothetical protein